MASLFGTARARAIQVVSTIRYPSNTLLPALAAGCGTSLLAFVVFEVAARSVGPMTLIHIVASLAIGGSEVFVAALLLTRQRSVSAMREAVMELPDAVLEVRPSGQVIRANGATHVMFRCPSPWWFTARSVPDLWANPEADGSPPGLQPGQRLRVHGTRADCDEFDLEVAILGLMSPDTGNVICLLRDVTEEVQLQERLGLVSRMEAVAEVADAVAHDFANILQVVSLQAELLRSDAGTHHSARMLSQASERASQLLQRLRGGSQPAQRALGPCDVNGIIERCSVLLRPVMADVVVVDDLSSSLPQVVNDAEAIDSAVTNLLLNARDAMDGKGTVIVTSRFVDERGEGHDRPRRVVQIAVRDNGPGVPEVIRPHIFERFFSTKPAGQGTGLGLAIVADAMAAIGGRATFEPDLGPGATFILELPLWEAAHAAPYAAAG